MNSYKPTADGAAIVAPSIKWMPIDERTPRGAKLLLISDKSGVCQIGIHTSFNSFFTHWAPLPTFGD
jgi:hypothetical protein